jgi:hypothetical protein
MLKGKLFLILLFAGEAFCASAQGLRVQFNDPHIRYSGRVAFTDTSARLSWTATSLKINFSGTGVRALLADEHGDNYYNVILDGKVISVLHPDSTKQLYTLAAGLPGRKHSLELFKRTEWAMGKTEFYYFLLDNHATELPVPEAPKRKMEVFGNSITCGYAVEDSSGQDRGTAPYENGYISYAAILARHYNAEYYCTSKSGIGITISWFPLIMPEMYDRLDANDPDSRWNFSAYTPDLVLINLFQNDAWLTNAPDNEQFKARFGDKAPSPETIIKAYRNFVKSVRKKYPKAQILCILGSMDATREGSPWPGYIEQAVSELKDKKIYTHFIPYKNTAGHPNAKEQQAMADNLIPFVDANIKW